VAPGQPFDRLGAITLSALYIAVQGHWQPV
jgi:hypothetical protein